MILISKKIATNAWTTLDIRSPDITAVKIKTCNGVVLIFNLYCDCTHNDSLLKLKEYIQHEAAQTTQNEQNTSMIWLGDFNRHYLKWDKERNSYLFTWQNLDATQTLIDATIERSIHRTLLKNLLTLKAMSTVNYTRTDNVFISANLLDKIIICTTIPEDQPAKSNHIPIDTTLESNTTAATTKPKYNYRQIIWEDFNKILKTKLEESTTATDPASKEDFNLKLRTITKAIGDTAEEVIPKTNPLHSWRDGGLKN